MGYPDNMRSDAGPYARERQLSTFDADRVRRLRAIAAGLEGVRGEASSLADDDFDIGYLVQLREIADMALLRASAIEHDADRE